MFGTLAKLGVWRNSGGNRDWLWKHNLFATMVKFPWWKRDNYGNANEFAFVTTFHCGKETNCRKAIYSSMVIKFQCGKETNMEMQWKLHLWWNSDGKQTSVQQSWIFRILALSPDSGKRKCKCQIIIYVGKSKSRVTSLFVNMTCTKDYEIVWRHHYLCDVYKEYWTVKLVITRDQWQEFWIRIQNSLEIPTEDSVGQRYLLFRCILNYNVML